MQPASGGFLEAVPLTSFVVMSLASVGRAHDSVVRNSVEFLLATVREDGSWPIDTNLAVWNTTFAAVALRSAATESETQHADDALSIDCLDWLLAAQHQDRHPMTGSPPGGWAWTDLPGGVPDVDDTSGALRALACWPEAQRARRALEVQRAVQAGVRWLLDLQNRDGGWPTFCRGWGRLPFDRSASDLTAHALRALAVWRGRWPPIKAAIARPISFRPQNADPLDVRIARAIRQGVDYLTAQQLDDGSWLPLWFGNQQHPQELNAVYGTARVLCALGELNLLGTVAARRAIHALLRWQHASGGWSGGGAGPDVPSAAASPASVEETALAVEGLLSAKHDPSVQQAISQGVAWLVEAVETNRHREAAPIGFYFAKLWYYERLYPLIFTASALGRAVARRGLQLRHACPSTQSALKMTNDE
jgi:squalene-hopene/tetraprenyl-beta-curcumene cyclase